MRRSSHFGFALVLAVAPAATAQVPTTTAPTQAQVQAPTTIGTHQIDRYEAIRQLQGRAEIRPQ